MSALDYSSTFINTYLTGGRVLIVHKGHDRNGMFARILSRDSPLSSGSELRCDVWIEIVSLRTIVLVDVGHFEVSR